MATSNCFCAIWPITMFELSPSVSDDDRVGVLDAGLAQQRQIDSVTDEEPAGPVLAEPSSSTSATASP